MKTKYFSLLLVILISNNLKGQTTLQNLRGYFYNATLATIVKSDKEAYLNRNTYEGLKNGTVKILFPVNGIFVFRKKDNFYVRAYINNEIADDFRLQLETNTDTVAVFSFKISNITSYIFKKNEKFLNEKNDTTGNYILVFEKKSHLIFIKRKFSINSKDEVIFRQDSGINDHKNFYQFFDYLAFSNEYSTGDTKSMKLCSNGDVINFPPYKKYQILFIRKKDKSDVSGFYYILSFFDNKSKQTLYACRYENSFLCFYKIQQKNGVDATIDFIRKGGGFKIEELKYGFKSIVANF